MTRALGRLLAQQDDGDIVASGAITYFEENGSTAFAQSLYTANSGGSPTASHSTDSLGGLSRYAPYSQRATFKVAGGTAFPINFDPDPADILTMGSDGLTATKGYRDIARLRVAILEAELRDRGGSVFSLEAFADGVTIDDGVGDTDAAWNAALAAIAASGLPGTIHIGPGTFLAPTSAVTLTSDLVIQGSGQNVTTVLHRAGSSRECFVVSNLSRVIIRDLTVDGNLANCPDFNASEITIESNTFVAGDNAVINCTVTNFNKIGIACGGPRSVVTGCTIDGPATVSYPNLATPGLELRFSGLYGILTSGGSSAQDVLISNCHITGLRSAAILAGGPGLVISEIQERDCHRGDFPAGVGGGTIALAQTLTTVPSDTDCTDWVITDCTLGPTAVNTYAGGIEVDTCSRGVIANCTINGKPSIGIKVSASDGNTSSIQITNCSINNINAKDAAATASGSVALMIIATPNTIVGVTVSNVSIIGCRNAIWTSGTTSGYSFSNMILAGNTAGWTKSDAATDWQSWGNHLVSGTGNLPSRSYQNSATAGDSGLGNWAATLVNASNTGHGLRVQGGSSASEFCARFMPASGSASLLVLDGAGNLTTYGTLTMQLPVASTNGQTLVFQHLTELTTIAAAATTDTTIQFPAGCIGLGVDVRVTTIIPTAATFDVGIAGATTRYGTGIAVAAGTTNASPGTTNPSIYAAATSVRITPNLTPGANTGRVRVTLWYIRPTAATS